MYIYIYVIRYTYICVCMTSVYKCFPSITIASVTLNIFPPLNPTIAARLGTMSRLLTNLLCDIKAGQAHLINETTRRFRVPLFQQIVTTVASIQYMQMHPKYEMEINAKGQNTVLRFTEILAWHFCWSAPMRLALSSQGLNLLISTTLCRFRSVFVNMWYIMLIHAVYVTKARIYPATRLPSNLWI